MSTQRHRTTEFTGEGQVTERVVAIRRVAKVVAGGRNFTFSALVVVGDRNGRVGIGQGRAAEVPLAVQKGTSAARKRMVRVILKGKTVPQEVVAKYGAARVLIKPALPGTGVIAGSSVRAVLEAAGVQDVLTKSMGSPNPINVVKATFHGLQMMRDPKEELARRKQFAAQMAAAGNQG
ncbi:MAG: 30S ribosomal protein S5 [Chloroflexi bacterium]|nr:30S ribosomal protein S5 [Chloroflexota bacterium]